MNILEIIAKKRDKKVLSKEEIDFFELITGDENKINENFSSENHNIILSDHDDYEI